MKRMTGTLPIVAGAIVTGTLCGSAVATTPDPVFWCWQSPDGHADNNSHFIKMIIPQIHFSSYDDPDEAAAEVASQLSTEDIGVGEFCLLFKGLGMGDAEPGETWESGPALFNHWCDALDHNIVADPTCSTTTAVVTEWWHTPWTSEGINETQAWIADWIDEYQLLQASDSTLPDPTRLHLDSENVLLVLAGRPYDSAAVFKECKNDTRWGGMNGEDLAGYNQTMDELWGASTDPTTTASWTWWLTADNRIWADWYTGVGLQTMEAALNQAVYGPMKDSIDGWSDLLCSNYETSLTITGSNYYRQRGTGGGYFKDGSTQHLKIKPSWEGSGDLQAPVFYPVNWNHVHPDGLPSPLTRADWNSTNAATLEANGGWPDAVFWEASMTTFRHNLWAILNSQSPAASDPSVITPWIMMNGNTHTVVTGRETEITKERQCELLTMLRGHGINEIILWGSDLETQTIDWNDLNDLVSQIWHYDIDSAQQQITNISLSGNYVSYVEYSLEDPASLTSKRLWDPILQDNLQASLLVVEFDDAGYDFGVDEFDLADTTMVRIIVTVELTAVGADDDIEFGIRINDVTGYPQNFVEVDLVPGTISADLVLNEKREFIGEIEISDSPGNDLGISTGGIASFLSDVALYVGARHKTSDSVLDEFTIEIDSVQLIPLD